MIRYDRNSQTLTIRSGGTGDLLILLTSGGEELDDAMMVVFWVDDD